MEEQSGTINRDEPPRKRTRARRRSCTRRSPLSCNIINMAEARKEIVNALQLHRSSSSSSSSSKNTHSGMGLFNNNSIESSSKYCYHQLMESMPAPEPTWSTTAPAVLCGAVPTTALELDESSFENNVSSSSSSSYSWWMGFLKSLDSGNKEVVAMGNDCYKEGFLGNLDVEKSADQCEDDHENNATEDDDWLIFTASDDEC